MITNGTIMASATSTVSARMTQRSAPRWNRSRGRRVATAEGPAGSRTRMSAAISAALLALARRLRPHEHGGDDDDDEGQDGRDRRAVTDLGLGEEVLVREVRRHVRRVLDRKSVV